MTPNNLSRKKFISFCQQHGYKHHPRRNEYYAGGRTIGYVYVTKDSTPFCRQYYENYQGFTFDVAGNRHYIDEASVVRNGVSRIAVDGTKAYSVTAH
jgi:hypothetical protein